MVVRELMVDGAIEFSPVVHGDSRGQFVESYRHEVLTERLGHVPVWRQSNLSVSAAGVLRGIHCAVTPPGQAKYVTVASGAARDFLVDFRVGSPTFGVWDEVLLDSTSRRGVYIPEGVGHAFLSLETGTTLTYLLSEVYSPEVEFTVDPFDTDIALPLAGGRANYVLSERDSAAPSLAQLREQGLLPHWHAVAT